MSIALCDFENKAREAVKAFWGNRDAAEKKQREAGKADQGKRAAVTAGKNMDGFVALMLDLVEANGLKNAEIIREGRVPLTLPGFFRPTKMWDFLVLNQGRLVAALELKSQVGSFGNNFNNRAEEAIGTAHDLWTAFREQSFGDITTPFVGWMMLVEDVRESRTPVKDRCRENYQVREEFQGATYVDRYNLLCQKLVREKLYTAASVIASPSSAVSTGSFADISEMTSLRNFVASFAGHISAEASR
jgi:hypothetical protein